jgi:hypothetical protein
LVQAWLERGGADARLKPNATQHAHGVRTHLNAGAKPDEAWRLLVDLRDDAAPMERRRKREPTHSGADDCNRWGHESQDAPAAQGTSSEGPVLDASAGSEKPGRKLG